MQKTDVTLTVTTTDPEILTRAVEALGRTLTALSLEGVEPLLYTNVRDQD